MSPVEPKESSKLDQIRSPHDLRRLPLRDLAPLAAELRERILRVVAKTGGHLAGPLGAVELNLALHYVFHTPEDRIVWDVGYQAYAHKLLTGRQELFERLRQEGGASGFLRRDESPYDAFGAGHAGTSISAAAGMAEAFAQMGETGRRVVAVIGDGALTAGMAYEALNHAGAAGTDLIVVLNDNAMSISPNVGALSSYLARLITGRLYTRMKRDTTALIRSIPKVGRPLLRIARRAEISVKHLLNPGLVFEEMGFRYVGPVDGHRLDQLVAVLRNARALRGPLLIHVRTRKGQGFPAAEQDPVAWHGVSPFDPETRRPLKKSSGKLTYTRAFAEALIRLARRDPRIVAITAAMPEGTGLNLFAREFPNRFYDVGIAEQHAVTFAAGLAAEGMRPVVAIYSTFLQRAYDQVAHDVCLQRLPVTFCMDRAGLVGEDGHTHHGAFDLAYLRHLPNMTLMAPKDENELGRILATALDLPGPAALRFPRGEGIGVPIEEDPVPVPFGSGELLLEGDDLLFLSLGSMVYPALQAAAILKERGISAAVFNARFVKPLDGDAIARLARRIRKVVTVEEHALAGGFGAAVLELLEERGITGVLTRRVGLPDRFFEHGAQGWLRAQVGLDPASIARVGEELVFGEGPVASPHPSLSPVGERMQREGRHPRGAAR